MFEIRNLISAFIRAPHALAFVLSYGLLGTRLFGRLLPPPLSLSLSRSPTGSPPRWRPPLSHLRSAFACHIFCRLFHSRRFYFFPISFWAQNQRLSYRWLFTLTTDCARHSGIHADQPNNRIQPVTSHRQIVHINYRLLPNASLSLHYLSNAICFVCPFYSRGTFLTRFCLNIRSFCFCRGAAIHVCDALARIMCRHNAHKMSICEFTV